MYGDLSVEHFCIYSYLGTNNDAVGIALFNLHQPLLHFVSHYYVADKIFYTGNIVYFMWRTGCLHSLISAYGGRTLTKIDVHAI